MTIERREHARTPVMLDVAVYYNSLVLLNCRTQDVSVDGVFVDTGGQLLPQNAVVDLRFHTEIEGHNNHHRLHAEVRHTEDNGVGLKFQHQDYNSFVTLANLFATA